jgi:hypothetical protein
MMNAIATNKAVTKTIISNLNHDSELTPGFVITNKGIEIIKATTKRISPKAIFFMGEVIPVFNSILDALNSSVAKPFFFTIILRSAFLGALQGVLF